MLILVSECNVRNMESPFKQLTSWAQRDATLQENITFSD